MDYSAGAGAVEFELLEVGVEVLHGVLADLAAGFAELLPVGHLADDAGALGLDDVGGMMDVEAELNILNGRAGSDGEGGRGFGIERGVAHWGASRSLARISARWRVCTPVC